MKTRIPLHCKHCLENFDGVKDLNDHRSGTRCMTAVKMLANGWFKNRNSGAWKRPK